MHGDFNGGQNSVVYSCNHKNGEPAIITAHKVTLCGSSAYTSEDYEADFVIDMNGHYPLAPKSILSGDKSLLEKLAGFAVKKKKKFPKVLRVLCKDFSTPDVSPEMWVELVKLFPPGSKVLITCQGGHGRTGTAMAALLAADTLSGSEAVNMVRKHYCKEAVETQKQEDYVIEVWGSRLVASGKTEKEAEKMMQKEAENIVSTTKKKSTLYPPVPKQHHKDFSWQSTYHPICPDCNTEAKEQFISYRKEIGSLVMYFHPACGKKEFWVRDMGFNVRQVKDTEVK